MSKLTIGKAKIDNITFDEAIKQILTYARSYKSEYIVTPNIDHVLHLENSSEFQETYNKASLVLAGGKSLIWVSRFLSMRLPHRISATDLKLDLCEQAASQNLSIFMLGAHSGIEKTAARELTEKHPNINICGVYNPPIGFENDEEENRKIVDMLNSVSPNMVFVADETIKQENWIAKHRPYIHCGVLLGIGLNEQHRKSKTTERIINRPRLLKLLLLIKIFYKTWRKYIKSRRAIFDDAVKHDPDLKMSKCTILDALKVHRLSLKSFGENDSGFFDMSKRVLKGFLTLKISYKKRFVGFVMNDMVVDQRISWCTVLAVDPGVRNKGLGGALINASRRAIPADRYMLLVSEKNTGAIHLYEKLGFSLTGNTKPAFYRNGENGVEMEYFGK